MNLKKELLIFVVLFVISSLVVHMTSFIETPIEQLKALFSHAMPYHPFLYVFLIYIVIAIIRFAINLLKKLFSKK